MKILLIEDNAGDVRLLCEMLAEDPRLAFSIASADRIANGLALLGENDFEIVLLDLSLPDGEGINTLRQVRGVARNVPIIILTNLNDEQVAITAVREGAQDYLIKDQIDRQLLVRAIQYACERQRLLVGLQSLALIDILTGLYNRRGFIAIAKEQLRLAHRMRHGVAMAFVDLDGMKAINDTLGHDAGDRALKAAAEILKSTFRNSDVLARLGGDEFVVLAAGTNATDTDRIRQRLQDALIRHNEQASPPLPLSLSVGFAQYDPATSTSCSIEELMAEADHAMYEQKQARRTSRAQQEGVLAQPRIAS